LAGRLDAALEAARVHRLALDHYLYALGHMKTYERQIRPALAGLDGLPAVLEAIRDMRDVRFETLESSAARFDTLIAQASRVSAPDDLAGVHATILSTLRMAKEACARRRHACLAGGGFESAVDLVVAYFLIEEVCVVDEVTHFLLSGVAAVFGLTLF